LIAESHEAVEEAGESGTTWFIMDDVDENDADASCGDSIVCVISIQQQAIT